MKNKVVVITGATSGIGQVAAENLAGMGAHIIQVARDRERGEAALKRLRECAPGAAHTSYYADLSRLSEVKRVARAIGIAAAGGGRRRHRRIQNRYGRNQRQLVISKIN